VKIVDRVRAGLRAAADPRKAAGMQAYMKSTMPYYGVSAVPLRAVCRDLFAALPIEGAEQWGEMVLALWRGAEHREERYVAIELTGVRAARDWHTLDALSMYEEIIVSGAWWDYVDHVASRRIGPMLLAMPKPMSKIMRAWSKCDDMWKRRTSIICQLGAKRATDLVLLEDCMLPSLESKEFFLRKAIGWALRQYAWTDAKWVKQWVKAHDSELSGLSKREALKNCG
jgi:3-methyladenine DNA glycosylase AlkD